MTLTARALRVWKAAPPGLRRIAHLKAQAAASAFLPLAVRLRWRAGREAAAPIVVVGLFSSTIGLGQGARLFADALARSGLAVWRLDVTATIGVAVDFDAGETCRAADLPVGGVLITHLNPPELELWLKRGGLRTLSGRRHIGYWAWETPRVPARWRRAFRYVDAVWCPSNFVADALHKVAPPGFPVQVLAHPIHVLPRAAADRTGFGLSAAACVVLVALDLRSTGARKNPQGALAAWLSAVPTPREDAVLVCKVSGAAAEPAAWKSVVRSAASRPDVRLLTETLSPERMASLVASVDVVLSLHRAEGFGLLLAEALWLGKVVIATGWSGNLDFMDAESAALVPWRLIPIANAQNHYHEGVWADPDVAVAAERLRALIDDPFARGALAARGAATARTQFAEEAWLAHFKKRSASNPQNEADANPDFSPLVGDGGARAEGVGG